jgi:hypothetical protein
MVVRFAAVAALAVLLSACTGASSTGIEPVSCPPSGTTLTYANYGQSFFASSCAKSGCHDHKSPVLTTQSTIQQHASQILDEAVYTDAMPESASMTIAEREQLGEWLACGAP